MPSDSASGTATIVDEQREVDMRRYQEAFNAGLCHEDAQEFAFGGEDIGLLRALVKDGCSTALIARILKPLDPM